MASFRLRLQLTGIALILYGSFWDISEILQPYGRPEGGALVAILGLLLVVGALVVPSPSDPETDESAEGAEAAESADDTEATETTDDAGDD